MNTLMEQIQELQRISRKLSGLGEGGSSVYADELCQLSAETLHRSDLLFPLQGETSEEEAQLCLSLLMGYNATIYDHGDKEAKKQIILDRSSAVLDQLSPSLLKCQLLTYCYGEVFEDSLAEEARSIMNSWGSEVSLEAEQEVRRTLQSMEENQYPNSDVEE